ncbi:hypothetical protein H8E52_10440 [bacterium]|nr:hypothetical protein [bacterium]
MSFKIDEHAKIAIVGLCEETQFTVTPGRHVVRVYRDDAIIVEKILQFSADMTNEVSLP